MAIVVYPVDAVTGAPTYTGRMARETLSPLLAGATAARPLGARSGVRPGTSETTVTATSTVWTMKPHAGILDMETAAEAGPYAYAVNTDQTGAVTAAHATLPRIDIVWVRLDDPAESDGSSVPAVVAGYTAGVAATTPAAPAAPARCMVLANINVPASGGGAPTVLWNAPYAVAAGAPIPVWSQADRDAKFPVPYDGLSVYRLDLHCVETYNASLAKWFGGPWSTWVPGLNQPTAIGITVNYAKYTIDGKTCIGTFDLTATGTGTLGTSITAVPPVATSATNPCVGSFYFIPATGNRRAGAVAMVPGSFVFQIDNSANTFGSSPSYAIAVGDRMFANFSYEIP